MDNPQFEEIPIYLTIILNFRTLPIFFFIFFFLEILPILIRLRVSQIIFIHFHDIL